MFVILPFSWSASRLRNHRFRVKLAILLIVSFLHGREPKMTRVPINRSYEASQDLVERLEMSTAEIGLTVRTTNCLEERGIFTVDDLLHSSREDLLRISNFGEKTLEEVYKALEGIGFYRPQQQPALVSE